MLEKFELGSRHNILWDAVKTIYKERDVMPDLAKLYIFFMCLKGLCNTGTLKREDKTVRHVLLVCLDNWIGWMAKDVFCS